MYKCNGCELIYDEIVEGTLFDELTDNWACPACNAPKNYFKIM